MKINLDEEHVKYAESVHRILTELDEKAFEYGIKITEVRLQSKTIVTDEEVATIQVPKIETVNTPFGEIKIKQ